MQALSAGVRLLACPHKAGEGGVSFPISQMKKLSPKKMVSLAQSFTA